MKVCSRALGIKIPIPIHDHLLALAGSRRTNRNRLINEAMVRYLAEESPKTVQGRKQNPQAA